MKKRGISINDEESLLGDILNKQLEMHGSILNRSNFFIAVFTFILGISILKIFDPSFYELNKYFQYSMATMGITAFICLLIIILVMIPKIKSKKYAGDNLFYYGGFVKKYSQEEYTNEIKKRLKNTRSLIDTYSKDIYEVGKFIFIPAYRKIRLASQIFILGLFVSIILLVLGFIL